MIAIIIIIIVIIIIIIITIIIIIITITVKGHGAAVHSAVAYKDHINGHDRTATAAHDATLKVTHPTGST
jgi:uncharacterized protein YxeA